VTLRAQHSPPGSAARLAVLAGAFIAVLDFFVVNVAIPSMRHDLGARPSQVQWVVAGYGLTYGVGLITGGRLGDRWGYRRMYLLGLVLFAVASALCGLAPSADALVAARILQGVTAALMVPQVLAILNSAYQGEDRVRAINAYGVTMVLASVFGQLIGGVLIRIDAGGLGWRACFLLNVPIAAVTVLVVRRLMPDDRGGTASRLDLRGAALVTVALTAVVLPLIEGREYGWPRWTWVSLTAAVALLGVFALHQRYVGRAGGDPLVAVELFRVRSFTVGLLAQLIFWTGQASFLLVFALYVQEGHALGPLGAGLAFLPLGIGYLITSIAARRLARLLGRQVIAVGCVTMAAGELSAALLVPLVDGSGQLVLLMPSLLVHGLGMGMTVTALVSTVMARIGVGRSGSAAGALTTAQQLGNALGVAVIGTAFYSSLLARDSYAGAFQLSLTLLGAIALTVAVLIQLLPSTTALPDGADLPVVATER
jgi:EmrB/QacA subfamily drug resistance transporter